jgi:hypothetical protein
MFPWLWIYAPQTSWPWSGAVTQGFTLDSFFRAIAPGAGVPDIEQRVFEQASYGKQLGWLTDVVVDAIDGAALRAPEARASFASLRELHGKIERIKAEHGADSADAAIALLDRLAAESPDQLRRILARYAGAIASSSASSAT